MVTIFYPPRHFAEIPRMGSSKSHAYHSTEALRQEYAGSKGD